MKFKPANSHSGRRTEMVMVIGATAPATPVHAAANCAPGFHCLFTADLAKYQFFNSVRDFASIITPDGRSPNNNSVRSDLQDRASSLQLRSPTTIHCLGS